MTRTTNRSSRLTAARNAANVFSRPVGAAINTPRPAANMATPTPEALSAQQITPETTAESPDEKVRET